MDSLTFSLLIFLNLIQHSYNLKELKKKRPSWQEYLRNEKEKLLSKRSKLANAADILDGKEFQI